MSYEMIVGLEVLDDQKYADYRHAMTPILNSYGGDFHYDFVVSKVLKNAEGRGINRVFLISFKDKESKSLFFDNPAYLEVKKKFFESSVGARTIIAEYEKI